MSTPVALHEWASRWSLPAECLADLLQCMGAGAPPPEPPAPASPGASESWAQSSVVCEAPRFGVWLTRNNVGVLPDKRGVPVRFGLANESPDRNKTLKSGDLIGIRSIKIEPHHVGTIIGQFVSREIKAPGWKFTGNGREAAQLAWAQLIVQRGGDAKFCTGPGSFG